MTNNQMQVAQQQAPANTKAITFQANGENVTLSRQTVRDYLVRGGGNVSDQEVVMFIQLCQYQKLNPFLNEAYLVKFGNQAASIITSKEAFMKRAEAHPQYEGFQAGIIVERNGEIVDIEGAIKMKQDVLIGGWCMVYRKDRKMPITVKISLEEFNKGQATWKQMPLTMIRKSAIVNALREAFPEALGAMYTEDDADVNKPTEQLVKEEIRQHANATPLDITPQETVHTGEIVNPTPHVEKPDMYEQTAQETLFINPESQTTPGADAVINDGDPF